MIGLGIPGLNIRLDIDLTASSTTVFAALTEGLDAWWPDSLRRFGGVVSLDPRIDGAMIEEGAGGAAAIWARVDCIVPGRALHLSGHFCIDAVVAGRVMFELTDLSDSACRMSLVHIAIGPVSVDYALNRRKLWVETLDGALRRYLAGS